MVVIAGKLTGKANARKKAVLHQEDPPGTTFVSEKSTVTNGSGIYKFVFPIHSIVANRDWYVTGPGGVRSPTVDEKVGAAIQVFAPATVLTGQALIVTADVFPLYSDTLFLQQRVGSSWKNVASAANSVSGSLLEFAYTPTATGTVTLRVWWPGDAETVATSSDTFTVVVKPSKPPTTTTTPGTTTTSPPPETKVTVTTEAVAPFTFTLSTSRQPEIVSDTPGKGELDVTPGTVTFTVSNPYSNIDSHTFEICTTPLAKPVGTLPGVEALANSCSGEATPVLAPGGAIATLTVVLTTPGAYEYLSTANGSEGDAASGMKGVLNVGFLKGR